MLGPGGEVAKLTIISIIRKPHLRANQEDFPVVYYDTTVVNHVLMNDRPVA